MDYYNASSKTSPWIATGCLSVLKLAKEILRYESKNGASKSTYNFIGRLHYRDYAKWYFYKHGENALNKYGAFDNERVKWNRNDKYLKAWKNANTGIPIIDSFMKELNT